MQHHEINRDSSFYYRESLADKNYTASCTHL
jgi:hypothetical protein